MEELRQNAYRHLLYYFLLEIRLTPTSGPGEQLTTEQQVQYINYAGAMAYQLHNLALAAAAGFTDFDEEVFWQRLDMMDARQPSLRVVERYRRLFEQQLDDNQRA